MKVCILQPHFLPFIGYFELMKNSNVFVFYDSAQFVKSGWHSRTPIFENNLVNWLTVPVQNKNHYKNKINQMNLVQDNKWKEKISRRLSANYHHNCDKIFLNTIVQILNEHQLFLSNLNIKLINYISNYLNLEVQFFNTSELEIKANERQEKILEICQYFNAETYICGTGSKFYISEDYFLNNGITVKWVNYDYNYWGKNKLGEKIYPSIIDVILRKGKDFTINEFKK